MTGSTPIKRDATINAPGAPAALGPYSQAVRTGSLLFLAGQTPIEPATGKIVDGGVTEQTRQVFANLGAVLAARGLTFDDAVKCNVYLVDMADFPAMNQVYAGVFDAPYPARTTVAVAALPVNARVEIELVAEFR